MLTHEKGVIWRNPGREVGGRRLQVFGTVVVNDQGALAWNGYYILARGYRGSRHDKRKQFSPAVVGIQPVHGLYRFAHI